MPETLLLLLQVSISYIFDLFYLIMLPSSLQLVTLPFCPESPKYLLLDRDDETRATSALTWFRGRVDVHDEMDEMRAEQEAMKLVPKASVKEMLTNSALRQPLIIAMMMMLAQQLTGINAVKPDEHFIFLIFKLLTR